MNDEMNTYREIRKLHLILVISATIVSILLFRDIKTIASGVLIGGLAAMIGFNSIIKMSEKIVDGGDMSRLAYTSYVRRYAVYALIFGLAVYEGVNPFALLAGYLCNKIAIYIYTWRHTEGG